VALDNRHALFPIHRSLRLLVVTGTQGAPTSAVPLTHVAGEPAALDACPERAAGGGNGHTVPISRELLETVSPETLAIPDLASTVQLRLLDRLWRAAPALSNPTGWAIRFGRELNATEDRHLFRTMAGGIPISNAIPVLEGKHIHPYRARMDLVSRYVDEHDAVARLPSAAFTRSRVAYRDVASASNQRTLIAAVVPAGTITTHTLFCCRTPLDRSQRQVLCALLNSFVANWIVRRWVSTHVTVTLIERLPMPRPDRLGRAAHRVMELAEALTIERTPVEHVRIEGELQALAATAWRVTRAELLVVLEDFPLLDAALKSATLEAFSRIESAGG
jgi:hypothetical protein